MISDTTKSRPPYNATAHMDITYFAGKRALEISKMLSHKALVFFFFLKLVKQSIYRSLRFQWYLFCGPWPYNVESLPQLWSCRIKVLDFEFKKERL